MNETRRLGRGLEALLGPISREQAEAQGALNEVAVSAIVPNPFQPRRELDPVQLKELADSIAASGLLQPIVVRPRPAEARGDGPPAQRYELIAGERRWRAVQSLGWPKIPAVLKEVDDRSLLTLALIENLQRDDLTPMDEARGFERLIREFELAQSEVAHLVGKDRATVANTLRLLKLPATVQSLVQERALSHGHARALLGVLEERQLVSFAHAAVEGGWSVRELEARVRGGGSRRVKAGARREDHARNAEVRRVEDALRERLKTDVRVTARRRGRGFITVAYYSNDDLTRLLELVLGDRFSG